MTTNAAHTAECKELVRSSYEANLLLDYPGETYWAAMRDGSFEALLDEHVADNHGDLCYCDY